MICCRRCKILLQIEDIRGIVNNNSILMNNFIRRVISIYCQQPRCLFRFRLPIHSNRIAVNVFCCSNIINAISTITFHINRDIIQDDTTVVIVFRLYHDIYYTAHCNRVEVFVIFRAFRFCRMYFQATIDRI